MIEEFSINWHETCFLLINFLDICIIVDDVDDKIATIMKKGIK